MKNLPETFVPVTMRTRNVVLTEDMRQACVNPEWTIIKSNDEKNFTNIVRSLVSYAKKQGKPVEIKHDGLLIAVRAV